MKQILQPFQAVLDRLAEFFFLFDLSFLVSGAAALAALVLGWRLFEGPVRCWPASTSPAAAGDAPPR